jgi:hypothetical protein
LAISACAAAPSRPLSSATSARCDAAAWVATMTGRAHGGGVLCQLRERVCVS